MESNNGLALVFMRNTFYKRMHYLALAAFTLTLFVIGVLSVVLFLIIKYPTKPLYFATDPVGRLIKVYPVSVPNMSEEELINWTIEAVQNALSYDFINYRAQFQSAQKYFTEYGWREYMKALTLSNNLPALTERKWVVLAQVVEKPTIVQRGRIGDALAWQLEMPVLVNYLQPPDYDNKTKFVNPYKVLVMVQRRPILQSYRGLGIGQLVATFIVQTSNQPQEITLPTSQ